MAFTGAGIDPGDTPTLNVAVEQVAGKDYQAVKLVDGTPGSETPVGTTANPMKVDDDATQAALASILAGLSPLATQVTLAAVLSALQAGITVTTGGLTDTQLRASAVPISSAAEGGVGDAAWTTGNGSIIAILKGIFGKLAGTLTVSGTVTSTPSGTQAVSAAALPLPAGAATETSNAATAAAAGTTADTAYVSGAGTIVAILKGIFGLVTSGNQKTQLVGSGGNVAAVSAGGSLSISNLGQSITDNNAFTDGTSPVLPIGYILDEVAGTALTENDAGAARMDSKRAQVLTLEDATTRGQRAAVDANGALSTKEKRAATPTVGNVASSATTGTLLASNAARLGAAVYNDSTQILYLKLGATASATSHTVQLVAGAYYEVPFGYTGVIDGIWASANGAARVTEVTV
jgi:hypothetical protein